MIVPIIDVNEWVLASLGWSVEDSSDRHGKSLGLEGGQPLYFRLWFPVGRTPSLAAADVAPVPKDRRNDPSARYIPLS